VAELHQAGAAPEGKHGHCGTGKLSPASREAARRAFHISSFGFLCTTSQTPLYSLNSLGCKTFGAGFIHILSVKHVYG